MATAAVLDVTEETFEADVLERSRDVPVVVDFWADWCGPCHALSPILERLAAGAEGSWVLAKIDVDSNQGLAAAAGIQGIPAVRAFKDGRQVAEFTGALPEDQVRRWLTQLGPSPVDLAFEEGAKLEAVGDLEAALSAHRRALDLDPGHEAAKAAAARLDLHLRSEGIDRRELEVRWGADRTDVPAAVGLADVYAAEGRLEEAYELLLQSIAATSGDERETARRHLISLLDVVPADDRRAAVARRELSRLLF